MMQSWKAASSLMVLALAVAQPAHAQSGDAQKVDAQRASPTATDNNNAVGMLPPDYETPYLGPTEAAIKASMDRVLSYIESETPMGKGEQEGQLKSRYRLNSYEWGVTYMGALKAGEVTGDARYTRYAADRINYLADLADGYRKAKAEAGKTPVRGMLAPEALDDAGAMGAVFIKAQRAGLANPAVAPQISIYLDWVANKQFRLADGTLARQRPFPVTLWLDDMFMGIPALAQMGKLTGETRYYDDAVRQVLQFSQRMFVPAKGLYMHGWVQGMEPHPAFHWGRANGWALLAMVELLDVLPSDHPGRAAVLKQMQAQVAGLAALQSGNGLWHQLLDHPDSYLETSASAIYAYAIAHGVNQGWLDRRAYAPVAMLAWQGVATRINAKGEIEDVCVGTGMGMDPAFYYHRPRHVRAAHGYGLVLMAGAEVMAMIRAHPPIKAGNNQGLLFN